MNKLAIVAGAIALTCSLALSGCAPGTVQQQPAPQQPEDKDLTYLYFTDGPDEQATRTLARQFEQKTGARVTIETVPFANLEQALQARLSGGNAPDVARVANLTTIRNDLLDLGQTQQVSLADQFITGAEAYTHTGPALVAVPSDLTVNGPFINVAQFKKAGVEIPTRERPWRSWAEMTAAATKVREANKTEYAVAMDASAHRFATMLSQYGTTYFSADGKSVALDQAKAARAIKDFNDLNQSGAMPKDLFIQAGGRYKGADEIFLAQQAPVYLSGNWQVAKFHKNAQFDWAAAPNPCQVRCGGFPGGKFMVAFKQSKRQKLAAEFIAFMNSKSSQQQLAAESNFLPTRTDLLASGITYPHRSADMKVFLDDVNQTPADTYGTSYSPAFNQAFQKAVMAELSSVLANRTTPEAAAAAIAGHAEKAVLDAPR